MPSATAVTKSHTIVAALQVENPQAIDGAHIHGVGTIEADGVPTNIVTLAGGDDTKAFILRIENNRLADGRRCPHLALGVLGKCPHRFRGESAVVRGIPLPPSRVSHVVESLIVGSNPHTALAVAEQSHHRDIRQIRLHDTAVRPLHVDAVAVGAHPQLSVRIVCHGENITTLQRMCIHDMIRIARVGQSALQMSHPHGPVAVGGQAGGIVRRQREQLPPLVSHGSDDTRSLVIDKHAPMVGGYPDVATPVVHHVPDGIVLRISRALRQVHHLPHASSSYDVSAHMLFARTIHP